MWKYDYQIGKPYFESDTEKVRAALNRCDANFPSGFVECEVQFRDPDIICPLLAQKKADRLRYTAESVQRFSSKTTIDIMEAVKYNKAVVTEKVFKALLFPDKIPIFRDTIRKLFNLRLEAGREKNDSKKQTIKLLLNSIHGKFEQMIRVYKNFTKKNICVY